MNIEPTTKAKTIKTVAPTILKQFESIFKACGKTKKAFTN